MEPLTADSGSRQRVVAMAIFYKIATVGYCEKTESSLPATPLMPPRVSIRRQLRTRSTSASHGRHL